MNKTLIYAIAGVLAIAIIAAAIIAGMAIKSGGANLSDKGSPSNGTSASIKDLLSGGKSQKCIFANNIDGIESSGVIYISSGKMRGDFIAKMEGEDTFESHMVIDGEYAYVWNNQMPQGMKMRQSMMGSQSEQTNGAFNLDEKVNYNCNNWSADQKQFSLPTGINFTDINGILPNAG